MGREGGLAAGLFSAAPVRRNEFPRSLLTRVLPRAAATVSVGGLGRGLPSGIHSRLREKPQAMRTRGSRTILTACSSFRPSAAAGPVIPALSSPLFPIPAKEPLVRAS